MGGITIDPSELGIEANTGKSASGSGNGSSVIDPKDLAPEARNVAPAINISREQASPSFTDSLKRGVGLTVRNYGPYVGASAAGAALGSEFGPPGMAAGAIAGPALLGLTDLAATGYNAIAPMLGGSKIATGTEAFDKLMDMAGVPRPATGGERFVQNITRAAVPTATTAKTMQTLATAPSVVTNGNLGRNLAATLATNPGSQIAASVGGSALPTIAQEGLDIQNPYALMGLGVLGSVGAGATASRMGNAQTGTSYANPEVGGLVERSRAMGVNLTPADVQADGAGRLQRALRTAGMNAEDRATQRVNEVTGLIERNTEAARPQSVVASGSADRAVAADLRTQYSAAKAAAGKLYDAVDNAISQQPQSGQMVPSSTQQAAASLKSQFPEWATLTNASRGVSSRVNAILDGIGQNGGPFTGVGGGVKTESFKDMRTLSKEVGQLVEASRTDPKLAAVHGQLKQLYSAIQSDFDTWAQTTGNKAAADAYSKAQDFFKTNVAPFRDDPTIYRTVSSRTPSGEFDKQAQKVTERILSSGNETTNLAVSLMSPEGRQALAFKVMEGARSRSISPDNATQFSAPAYMRGMNLGRADTPTPQRIALEGVPGMIDSATQTGAIVDATRGALTPKVAPQTGVRLMPLATTGTAASIGEALGQTMGLPPMVGGTLGAVGVPSAARGLDALMGTQAGTRFMLGQGYKPGSGLLQIPIFTQGGQ